MPYPLMPYPRRTSSTPGRKPIKPTAQQIHDANAYAETGISDSMIAEAVGIAHATFSYNKGRKHFAPFLAAIRAGRATGSALVAGKDYKAALSDTDATRSQARDRYLKHAAGWKDRLEVSEDPAAPVGVKLVGLGTVQQLLREMAARRRKSQKP